MSLLGKISKNYQGSLFSPCSPAPGEKVTLQGREIFSAIPQLLLFSRLHVEVHCVTLYSFPGLDVAGESLLAPFI